MAGELPPDQYFIDRWPAETAKNLLLTTGLGAGAAGLYHAFRSLTAPKPKKKHTKFYPGPQPAEEEKKAQEAGPSVWKDPGFVRPFFYGGLLNIAGGSLAAMGGAHLMNKLVRNNKKQKYEEQIEEARKMYEDSLRGEKVAALHTAFQTYAALPAEKKASITDALGKAWNSITRNDNSPLVWFNRTYGPWAGATMGLSGAVGAGLAYDFTKQRTQAAAMQRAQEARARMSALPPMWVEPDAAVLMKRKQRQAEEDNDSEASSKAASA
jgi:hypothetical protein